MTRTRLQWVLIAGSAAAIGVGAALGTRALTQMIDATLPDARGVATFNRPGTITLLSTNGRVIQKLGPATREKLKEGEMPILLQQAFIAAEDRRFYEHDGVDGWGIARAIVTNVRQASEKVPARSRSNWRERSFSAKTEQSPASSRKQHWRSSWNAN